LISITKSSKRKLHHLKKWTREYSLIAEFVQNTHAEKDKWFSIELCDVFELEREGEDVKFEPFKKLKHHRMLIHGSRATNFIGILSQGLRIAPPEAPVTGYFFGKGVYFADMISKSAEYCYPTKEKPYALMLLSDIALGRPYQISHTKFISKEDLDSAGYHSVKGCGELAPNPVYDTEINDGLIISVGKECPTGVYKSEIKHNEFIVYDTAQVKAKYLLKVKIESLTGKDIKAISLVNAN